MINKMKKISLVLGLLGMALTSTAFANEGPVPKGIHHLDHVFVIMMENTSYGQIINNPNAPFINSMAHSANLATNYFAIGHPSLTNYLEVVGVSNSVQYFPLISVQLFPLFQPSEGDFCAA